MADPGYVLGVLGGMGPRASSEFLRTLYRHTLRGPEQTAPRVVLDSDPTFPDRTESLLSGSYAPLLAQLSDRLRRLCAVPVSEVVICCVTAHALLPELPAEVAGRVVSLVDIALGETVARRERQLLLCTTGTRRVEVFQRHPLWERASALVVLPDARDQRMLHELIYRLKRNTPSLPEARAVNDLLARYEVNSCIAGCTELHLLSAPLASGAAGPRRRCVDPLRVVARRVARSGRAGLHSAVPPTV